MIPRRIFVAATCVLLTASRSAFAQGSRRLRRIGVLWENEPSFYANYLESLKGGLRELGYLEHVDYLVEQRSAKNELSRLRGLADELVAAKVDILIPSGTPAALAARQASRDIPILIVTAGDPVASGLAVTLRRPGGNVTGLTSMGTELDQKRLDLLAQIRPGLSKVGFLYSPDNAVDVASLPQFQLVGSRLNIAVLPAPVRRGEDVSAAFDALVRDGAHGVVVTVSGQTGAWRALIIEQAERHRLPAIYGRSYFPEGGGLMSYGVNFPDLWRRAAAYVDKFAKGAKPEDLPIEQPIRFESLLNMRAARAIGISVPQSLLLRFDKVID